MTASESAAACCVSLVVVIFGVFKAASLIIFAFLWYLELRFQSKSNFRT